MRLLDTNNLKLHEFHGDQIPSYAILSHTWGKTETSFGDLQLRNKPPYRVMVSRGGVWEEALVQQSLSQSNANSEGWQKIRGCCSLASGKGHEYVWIDTCCINKESSAELTEAINSMFRWYSSATVCFAYLGDVPTAHEDPRALASTFRHSKWFRRGWTLQELLAPRIVEFYSADWDLIGTSDTLNDVIAEQTGVCNPLRMWRAASVATKMSWASQRECSRPEDIAYSLLGLFGISMPPLYGEGRRAFYRLQLEILKQSADESIFAWTTDSPETNSDIVGLLAESPSNFYRSRDLKPLDFDKDRSHYSITNKGLRIETPILHTPLGDKTKVIPLNCSSFATVSDGSTELMTFPLIVTAIDDASNVFFRVRQEKAVMTLHEWREIWSAHKLQTPTLRRSIYIMM